MPDSTTEIAEVAAVIVAAVNAAAAGVGAYQWWRVAPSPAFWALARLGQVLAILQALVAGGL